MEGAIVSQWDDGLGGRVHALELTMTRKTNTKQQRSRIAMDSNFGASAG